MGYAVNSNGSWRTVASPTGIVSGETYQYTLLQTLNDVKISQIGSIYNSYLSAIQQPVTYNGVVYQSDANSVSNLSKMIDSFPTVTPTGFYWVAADNSQVPFAAVDLKGLALAMAAQGWAAFQHLQTQKAAVLVALDVPTALSVAW